MTTSRIRIHKQIKMEKELKAINKKLAEIESMCANLLELLGARNTILTEIKTKKTDDGYIIPFKGKKGK